MPAITLPSVSQDFLKGVMVTEAIPLDTQPVFVAFLTAGTTPDAQTPWLEAEWTGAVGTTRVWRFKIGPDTLAPLPPASYFVYVRVIDVSEKPVRVHADTLKIV